MNTRCKTYLMFKISESFCVELISPNMNDFTKQPCRAHLSGRCRSPSPMLSQLTMGIKIRRVLAAVVVAAGLAVIFCRGSHFRDALNTTGYISSNTTGYTSSSATGYKPKVGPTNLLLVSVGV